VAAANAQKFGKDAITQAYLWPRMGKWYRENDIIVSETGYVLRSYVYRTEKANKMRPVPQTLVLSMFQYPRTQL
jgi:TPP-dependent 2-oxoacid decarboxylase